MVCSITATATATIIIDDVNDNPPSFDPDFYERQVSELAGPLSFIIQVNVRDLDSDAVFYYNLDEAALQNFTIDSEGSIYIRDQQVTSRQLLNSSGYNYSKDNLDNKHNNFMHHLMGI